MIHLNVDANDLGFIRDCISDRLESLADLHDNHDLDFAAEMEQAERLLQGLK